MTEQIKTIKLKLREVDKSILKKVAAKYAHLSEAEKQEISSKIGMEIFLHAALNKIKEGECCYLELIGEDENGEVIITKQKIYKEKGQILFDAKTVQESIGIDKAEIDEVLAAEKGNRTLAPNEYFVHPLSETIDGDKETYINMYGVASTLINGVRNHHGFFNEDLDKCEAALRDLLAKINPLLNVNFFIAQIKLHNLREMMHICTLIATADLSQFIDKK